jgi:hypothetical protein
LSLTARTTVVDQQWEMVEEQCERLVHDLTLLSVRGSELCNTITSSPPLSPLHEGMCFTTAQHTEVPMWLSAHWVAVSPAAHSILGCLPVDISQVGVVGDMVIRFQVQGEWCSHLEASSFEVCDLVLWPMDGQTYLVAHLEEVSSDFGRGKTIRELFRDRPLGLMTWHRGGLMMRLP